MESTDESTVQAAAEDNTDSTVVKTEVLSSEGDYDTQTVSDGVALEAKDATDTGATTGKQIG